MEPAEVFSFCPKCGEKLGDISGNVKKCLVCNFRMYINPIPSITLILSNKNGEILLLRRKIDPSKGKQDLLGGFVELNETSEDAARRECKEEIGVNLRDLHYQGAYKDRYLFNGLNYFIISNAYSATIEDESQIKLNEENTDYSFVNIHEINTKELAFQSIQDIVEDYKKNLRIRNQDSGIKK